MTPFWFRELKTKTSLSTGHTTLRSVHQAPGNAVLIAPATTTLTVAKPGQRGASAGPSYQKLAGCQLKRLISISQMPSRRKPIIPITTTIEDRVA